MHAGTQKDDVILAKNFQQHLKKSTAKMVSLIKESKKYIFMERKYTDRKYHVKYNAAVEHQDLNIYCNTNQFPELSFVVHILNLMAQGG